MYTLKIYIISPRQKIQQYNRARKLYAITLLAVRHMA